MKKYYLILFVLCFGFNNDANTDLLEKSFDEQFKVFKKLGYKLNRNISKDILLSNIRKNDKSMTSIDSLFVEKPFENLYYYLGTKYEYPLGYYSEDCIYYDLEFIDSKEDYKWLMIRMGEITKGEINFSNINLSEDQDNYQYIEFKVNGLDKKWKLEKAGYIDEYIFDKFARLNKELDTNGKYTCYNNNSQSFVIDYATPQEQEIFIKETKLKRKWLIEGIN